MPYVSLCTPTPRSGFEKAAIIVAGDLGVSLGQARAALMFWALRFAVEGFRLGVYKREKSASPRRSPALLYRGPKTR